MEIVQIAHDPTRSVPSWGGARANAGRRAKGPIASEPHHARPQLSPHHPVHVIARVAPGVRLRGSRARRAVARALRLSLARADFRIVELGVRAHAIELVVEADDRIALARGMQGFEVAAARLWNRLARRRGCVFADRYRARALTTHAEVRAALGSLPARRAVAVPATWLLTTATRAAREPAARHAWRWPSAGASLVFGGLRRRRRRRLVRNPVVLG